MLRSIDIAPQAGDNFAVANFTASIPENVKGVLVLIPGSNGDGRLWIHDYKWRRFARRHSLAVLGVYFADKERSWIEQYIEASKGSGRALLTALDKLGLAGLPLYMFGFSAGGEFNYEFTCWLAPKEPGRIKAFIVNKGGVYMTALAPQAARDTPSIWFSGLKDAAFRQNILRGIYGLNYVAGCRWEEVQEHCTHDICGSEVRSIYLFEHLLAQLPEAPLV